METNLMMVLDARWWGGITIWWVEMDGLWKPWMSFDWCVLWGPTFMLGIWHVGEWLKRDLSQPFYSWVECGSPILGWILHHQYEVISPHIYMNIILNYMRFIWLWFHWYFLYSAGYVCALWQQCMDFLMLLLVIEWSLYLWPNGSWSVEASMVLNDSLLSMRPLCSKLLFTPVDYICIICLMKFLSWIVGVQSKY